MVGAERRRFVVRPHRLPECGSGGANLTAVSPAAASRPGAARVHVRKLLGCSRVDDAVHAPALASVLARTGVWSTRHGCDAGDFGRRRELAHRWANDARWSGIERPYDGGGRGRACAAASAIEHTLARLGAERLWQLLATRAAVPALGALTGGQAVQMVQGRARGDLPLRLAGRGRREPRRRRPTPTRASTRRTACRRSCGASTTRCRAPTRSTAPKGATTPTGSRRSSPTPRPASAASLNAFELMKAMIEAGRRRRPLRGPARGREEVRPPGRQGARPDAASSSAR